MVVEAAWEHRGRSRNTVLTLQHYEQLAEQRGALLGLLQAMLLTCHGPFVGYSLSDDDFYSVMSDVRRILGEAVKWERY